jgi:ectoine hydroxylase-related dioxygenase (phytanoyl-CoA dioxygenase family)
MIAIPRRFVGDTATMLDPAAIDTHASNIEKDGYTVVHGLVDPAFALALKGDIERLEKELAVGAGENLFEGFKTRRIYNLLARGKRFEEAAENDGVFAIVERVLGKGFLVSTVSTVCIEPGETAQPIHADDQLIPLPKPHPPLTCTVMWAIDDFTEENGGTRVIPGSHKRAENPDMLATHDVKPTVMKRGSVLIYNGSVWHGGGANLSSERRVAIAIGYCVGWMRQQENQQLGVPLEIARGFSPRLRKLAGFGLYKMLYGHIDKCSPADLLDQSGPRVVVGVVKS